MGKLRNAESAADCGRVKRWEVGRGPMGNDSERETEEKKQKNTS